MLESCKNAQERWGGVHQLIDRWLSERRELLVSFSRLSQALHDKGKVTTTRVEEFRELLVDYLSAGHFEIFEQLMHEAKAFEDQEALKLLDTTLPWLHESTQQLMQDEEHLAPLSLADLEKTLGHTGELLAERFEQEDLLIGKLHAAHAPQESDQLVQ